MKILFFCGSLDRGRDGVGDYTRRLAFCCRDRGHDCTVIALHEAGASHATDLTAGNVRCLRLPAAEPWATRLERARALLHRCDPDWVSWQFVAQGLHPRGFLPAALLQAAPELRGRRCHVMLHELWLGLEAGAGWRARLIGWLQRRGIICLLGQLAPDCLHTSNAAYQHVLRREGFPAGLLGLFGNVDIADDFPRDEPAFARWLPGLATPLVAVTFGTLHPQWRPAATIAWLGATARRLGRRPALLAVGRTGAHAAAILAAFRQQGIAVGVTGELPDATVSQLLRAADLGVAPHPWALIGKSGAAAAMLEHGLPVLVPRDDWHLRDPAPEPAGAGNDPLLVRLAGLDAAGTDRWLGLRRAAVPALSRTTAILLAALAASPVLS